MIAILRRDELRLRKLLRTRCIGVLKLDVRTFRWPTFFEVEEDKKQGKSHLKTS